MATHAALEAGRGAWDTPPAPEPSADAWLRLWPPALKNSQPLQGSNTSQAFCSRSPSLRSQQPPPRCWTSEPPGPLDTGPQLTGRYVIWIPGDRAGQHRHSPQAQGTQSGENHQQAGDSPPALRSGDSPDSSRCTSSQAAKHHQATETSLFPNPVCTQNWLRGPQESLASPVPQQSLASNPESHPRPGQQPRW